ncbi:redoxin domain-containing protein [Aeoliella sp. ICT_H6.2]|uniref:Redoxin domain-containing protein n=1 Tax=Aeoliella straminimaris TaxID=2954799 RepID=A0A9X2JJD8_9BACT|nr:thioredoxin-like domain-containing protein [Aeoliella straminimaris]MCO6046633.1 redoxin domain-containing protein [Aeoliella straminimaris]
MSLRSSAFIISCTILTVTTAPCTSLAATTARQALGLKPIQSNIDYDRPEADEIDKCKIQSVEGGSAWVVTGPDGRVLRRFADSNSDKVVDTWSYFKSGLEVYRDIDADFDGKADQYRWFHSAGTRWGLDEDENGKIDSWKRISPYEVAEVAVEAIQKQDASLYSTLLMSNKDVDRLGIAGELKDRVTKGIRDAQSDFTKFAKEQKVVDKSTSFLDFGASRPAIIPAGGEGVKQDLHVYENVAALVNNNGKPEQVYLGAMVQTGDTWRLIGLPQIGDSSATAQLFNAPQAESVAALPNGEAPSEEVQKLLAELEKLDTQFGGTNDQQIAVTKKRVQVLEKLAAESPAGADREQWQRQQVDMLSAAVQTMQYYDAIEQIEALASELKKQKASEELQAHVEFRRLWSEYIKASMDPKGNYTKVRDAWLESLQKFATDYPNLPDTSEAMLQLGMEEEFAGEEETAIEWYSKLAKQFPNSDAGKKATGAIRRLESIGKAMPLAGDAVGGGKVDLSGYRRKYVLIHYWASWCEPCKEDIEELKVLHNKYSRRGFDIIGVNLDSSVSEAEKYLSKNRLPWKHVYDEGGLDGRLANEMGVMTLPLMLLVDDKGQVANRNVHISELEAELQRVLGKAPQIGRR